MRELRQTTGNRKWKGDDWLQNQSTFLRLTEDFYGQYGNFILTGCVYSNGSISEGVVILAGKACLFASATGVVAPYYVKQVSENENVEYETGQGIGFTTYRAVACAAGDTGAFRLDNALRFTGVFKPNNAANADNTAKAATADNAKLLNGVGNGACLFNRVIDEAINLNELLPNGAYLVTGLGLSSIGIPIPAEGVLLVSGYDTRTSQPVGSRIVQRYTVIATNITYERTVRVIGSAGNYIYQVTPWVGRTDWETLTLEAGITGSLKIRFNGIGNVEISGGIVNPNNQSSGFNIAGLPAKYKPLDIVNVPVNAFLSTAANGAYIARGPYISIGNQEKISLRWYGSGEGITYVSSPIYTSYWIS